MSMKSVYVVGDSISIHYGPYLKQYINNVFMYDRKRGDSQTLETIDISDGANGGDSSMVLEFLCDQAAQIGKFDILLFNCGLHDIKVDPFTMKKQVNILKYEENLKNIIKLLKEINLYSIWTRTTPVNDEQHKTNGLDFFRFNSNVIEYNTVADKLMIASNIPIIDLYTFTKNLHENSHCDGVHFHENVRGLQAAFIAGYLSTFGRTTLIT